MDTGLICLPVPENDPESTMMTIRVAETRRFAYGSRQNTASDRRWLPGASPAANRSLLVLPCAWTESGLGSAPRASGAASRHPHPQR
jgi:hypothetical protein